jgi:hypothetical protein
MPLIGSQASGFLASQRGGILAFALRQPIIRRALRGQPVLFPTAFTLLHSSTCWIPEIVDALGNCAAAAPTCLSLGSAD